MCLQTHLWVCTHIYHLHTPMCSRGERSVVWAPIDTPLRSPPQQRQENKEAGGSASGYRSSPLCSRSAGSHRRRSQFNLLYLTDQELWAAANETGLSPVCRSLKQPTQSRLHRFTQIQAECMSKLMKNNENCFGKKASKYWVSEFESESSWSNLSMRRKTAQRKY